VGVRFEKGSELKKYLALIFIGLIAIATYLYNYSLNINVQKFRIYSNLYFKNQDFTKFAQSILLYPNVKEIGYKRGAVRAEYFQPTPVVPEEQLIVWENQLKEHSILFAKITDREVFFYIGSISYQDKSLLVGIIYNSEKEHSNNCLTKIQNISQGQCNEKYNENWLINYYWHERFLPSQT